MPKDLIILLTCWALAVVLIFIAVTKETIRGAWVVFMFKQLQTWIMGLTIVEFGLIKYPYRLFFPYAMKSSFSFEYFIYPATCVLFVLRFPVNKSRVIRTLWYLFFPTWMTIVEYILENNTNLIHYIHWTWYYTWLSLLLTFILSRVFYNWFFHRRLAL